MARTTPPDRASIARRACRALAGLALLPALLRSPVARSDEPPRDVLHPGRAEIGERSDPRGASLLRTTPRRSPAGLLYPHPSSVLPGGERPWAAAFEIGAFFDGGDEDEARFENYADRDDGVFLSLVNLSLARPEWGDLLRLDAGSVGCDDQFYALEAGRAGRVRLRGSFSGIPRRYANDARILFAGTGSELLRLPAGLTPGASSEADIAAALPARGEREVEVQRDRTRTQLRLRLRPELSLVGHYGFDDRSGELPFGAAFSFPNLSPFAGGMLEVPVPVDDHTHTFGARLEYEAQLVQANLSYDGSAYRNETSQLLLENPFNLGGAAPIERGRMALAPDNDWHDVKAAAGVSLPLRSRATATVSWSTRRQDEELLPPTTNDVAFGSVDLALWNSRSALSRQSAEASVDALLVDLALRSNPWRPLRLRAGMRYSEQENDTDYVAFNPSTDEFGYIVEDGGHGSVLGDAYTGIFQPGVAGSNWRYRNIPFGQTRRNFELGAALRTRLRSTLDLRYRHEDWDRDDRERSHTREDRLRASWNARALPGATLRLSYEWAGRDGGRNDFGVFSRFYSESLPGFVPQFADGDPPHNLQQLARPELANRIRGLWKAQLVAALGERMDLGLSTGYRTDDYRQDFGLRGERASDVQLEWSLEASPDLQAHAFVGVESYARGMANIRGVAASTDGNAGGPTFPLENAWRVESSGSSMGWGGGLSYRPFASLSLSSSYYFLVGREEVDPEFANALALAAPAFPLDTIASRLPELRNRDHVVETSVRWELRESVALRLFHRYQRSAIDDFHQKGLPALDGHRLFFAHADEDFDASLYGVALQAKF